MTGAADAVLNSLYWLDQQKRIDLQTAVVMPDHLHILRETPSGNLPQIMRHINGAYTTYFNWRPIQDQRISGITCSQPGFENHCKG